MGLLVAVEEALEMHQKLIRDFIESADYEDAIEYTREYGPVEDQEMLMEALKNGRASDVGYLFIKMMTYAATQETLKDAERMEEELENERAGAYEANARLERAGKRGVWVSPGIRGM